jgi:Uncharacterized iron-regulated membrane protein
VQNSFLLDLYHINPEQSPGGYSVGDHWISQIGGRIYFDRNEVADNVEHLIGIAALYEEIVIAYDGKLLLLDEQGEVIEHLNGSEGVPAGMRAIGITASHELVIRGAHGDYLVDLENLKWHEEDYIKANWSQSQPLPEALSTELLRLYRGKGLPLERVILDLHSGRLLGAWGVYLVDLAAILFVLLAFSGIWMWTRRKHI